MSSFKVNITLQADFTSQELADFFAALAQSERGDVQPLMRILHPVDPPPIVEQVQEPPVPVPALPTVTEPEAVAVTVAVPEPPVTEALKWALMETDISCERLNSIIRRHNWARGQKARIERHWGFSKASCFARIGFHFNDYSLMDGSVKSEEQLLQWVRARGFMGTF